MEKQRAAISNKGGLMPEYIKGFKEIGIDFMNLNTDSVLKTIQDVDKLEAQLGRR